MWVVYTHACMRLYMCDVLLIAGVFVVEPFCVCVCLGVRRCVRKNVSICLVIFNF